MNIVIDSNVLFSALVRDSTTRKIILEYDGVFLFPSYILEETEKHKAELLEKSDMSVGDFNALLSLILRKVVVVPDYVLRSRREEALDAVKDIDLGDVVFVACVLSYPNSILWSDDKKLKKLQKISVLNTGEIINVMKKKFR